MRRILPYNISIDHLRAVLFFSFFLLLCCSPRAEAEDASNVSRASQTREDFASLLKGVTRITLSNGLRILMYHRGIAPVFSGQTWVRVGGVNEVPGKTGVAHMLEHMAFKGTERVGTKDYEKEAKLLDRYDELISNQDHLSAAQHDEMQSLEKQLQSLWVENEFSRLYSARGASGLNAQTAKDYTNYMVSLPSVAFEFWCWMESDRLMHPVFRQFYKEREVVREERRMSFDDNPDGLLYEALLSVAYWNHPYRLPVIGWGSDIEKLQRRDIEKLYWTYYRPDNMVISLVGDLDPETARPLLEKYFGRIPRPATPLPQVTAVEPEQKGERTAVVEFDANPAIMIGFHKPVHPHPDDAYFSVLHAVLSDGRTSMLYRRLVEEKKLASSIETTEAPGELFPSMFIVAAQPRRGVSPATLRDAIQEVLDELKKKPLDDATLQSAKRRVRVSLIDDLDSSSGLSTMLGHAELLWGNWEEYLKLYERVQNTTAADIQRIAQAYLNTSNRTYVALERPQK